MVVFTCGHCGESIQKPKVEKHYLTKCRNRNPNLSCMDCFKDFLGQDFQSHTKCITEEQRYSAKGFVAKEKKGEQKQNVWVELIQSVLDEQKNASANVLRIIKSVSAQPNVPRKKAKFINFVKNVCGHKTNAADMDSAWNLISVKLADISTVRNGNNKQLNGDLDKENKKDENNTKQSSNEEEKASENVENVEKVEKKSKKEKKDEKKRRKYEAELQNAAQAPEEVVEEKKLTKKEKKMKHKFDTAENGGENIGQVGTEGKKKNKRKRTDTVNEVPEIKIDVNVEEHHLVNGKSKKKKPKVNGSLEVNESLSLHDQNVEANEEQETEKKGNFDWHATIISVLEKKNNEISFKKLQKKVLGEYTEVTGQAADDRIAEKFIKKIKSAPKVKVDKNKVILEE